MGNTAAHPRTQSTLHKKKSQKKNKVGIPYPLLTTANEAYVRLMYATVRGGTVCNWKSNIKHRMECQ